MLVHKQIICIILQGDYRAIGGQEIEMYHALCKFWVLKEFRDIYLRSLDAWNRCNDPKHTYGIDDGRIRKAKHVLCYVMLYYIIYLQ